MQLLVGSADVRCFENGDERSRRRGLLDSSAPARLFALPQADDADHLEPAGARSFDGLYGRGAGGADVVHDDGARALATEPFDALPGPVPLFRLPHQEAMDEIERAAAPPVSSGPGLALLRAEHGDGGHDGV